MNNYYVYIHKKATNGQVFYVGIGSQKNKKRAYQTTKNKRNEIWHRIVNKYGLIVEILFENISKESAFSIEIELIKKYGRIDLGTGCLSNRTNGGDGCGNISGMKGKKMPIASYEKVRAFLTGRVISDETKKKMSIAKIGKKHSKEHTEKIKKTLLEGTYNSKIVINTKTNQEFNSISKAANFYNLSVSDLNRKLNGKRKNNTDLILK